MILKRGGGLSDTAVMLFSARSAPELDSTRLRSVRRALNSPVVAIAELPVGPASAAIAIHCDPSGAALVSVAVRCRRTGDVVFFVARSGEDAPASNPNSQAAALSLAEGMGFVFDDEVREPEARGAGLAIWREFSDAEGVPETETPPLWLSKFRWSQPQSGASTPAGGTRG